MHVLFCVKVIIWKGGRHSLNGSKPEYRIKHIGINHPDAEQAMETAKKLCEIFDLPLNRETGTRIFAGNLFEVKKNCARGRLGHIALQTEDIETAINDLATKGIGILEETIRRKDDGRISFVFLDFELAGFAFHLEL